MSIVNCQFIFHFPLPIPPSPFSENFPTFGAMNDKTPGLILASLPNFRDLGGISGAGGRKVRPGMLYRSGDLSRITDEDLLTLEALDVRAIIDLRAQREIVKHPDRVPATVKNHVVLHIHDKARDHAERLFAENNGKALESVLTEDYVRMVRYHRNEFREFLRILAETDQLPLVFHCAAGKDRTGLATLFLLTALGVSAEDIRSDYLATNHYVAEVAEKIIRKVNETGQNGEILRPLLLVREAYLDAALETLDREFSGPVNYVNNILKADTEKLRERFLEG